MTPDPLDDAPGEKEVSLERLSEAFAQALGKTESTAEAVSESPAEPSATVEEPIEAGDASESPADKELRVDSVAPAAEINPASVLEAMLFVGHPDNEPLTAKHAAGLMRGVEPAEVHDLVGELNRRYDTTGCPYQIISEGAGYRLALREDFHRLRNKFYGRIRAARLSQVAIEVLSLVAYEQPLTREDVDRLRGIASDAILRQLVRRRLLRIERTDTKPRKTLYYTTKRFLKLLGMDSLEDLPQALELDRR